MSNFLTTREFHNVVRQMSKHYSITQCRRWVRDALPEDPKAKARSGYIRRFSFEDAFAVFLFGWLIDERHFDKTRSRKIVDDIRPWILRNLSPIETIADRSFETGWELIAWGSGQGSFIEARKLGPYSIEEEQRSGVPEPGKKYEFSQTGLVELVCGDYTAGDGSHSTGRVQKPTFQCLQQTLSSRIVIPIDWLALSFSLGLSDHLQKSPSR